MISRCRLVSLAQAVGAQAPPAAAPAHVTSVSTDTRSLQPGSLFVALRGERFDGHDFLAAAVSAGAAALLVDHQGAVKAQTLGAPCLVVSDTLRALGDLAQWVRRQSQGKVVAVTGSNGKTTTKEMLAAVLGPRGQVHKNTGNLNNLVGMPLTLLAWPQACWAAVVELGMSELGEIARLTEIAAPDVGVITMVGPAHLQQLGTIDNIALAKAELFRDMPRAAIGVVNLDDELIGRIAVPALAGRSRVTFGTGVKADVRVRSVDAIDNGLRVRLDVAGKAMTAELPVVGPHNAMNAAAAVAVGYVLGLEIEAMAVGLKGISLPAGRLHIVRRPEGVSYIDDSYNANPASMRAGFGTLVSIAKGRCLAVVGDMLELGPEATVLHREIGRAAAAAGVTAVFALGAQSAAVAEGARDGGAQGHCFADIDTLVAALDDELRPGDFVLVKGSRGMKMERVVAHLAERR